MGRSPALVLLAGVVAASYGVVLLVLGSNGVEGVIWLGVCITAGGLLLLGLWLRNAGRRPAAEVKSGALPGRWYPWAILAILALLLIWIAIWVRHR